MCLQYICILQIWLHLDKEDIVENLLFELAQGFCLQANKKRCFPIDFWHIYLISLITLQQIEQQCDNILQNSCKDKIDPIKIITVHVFIYN